MENNAGGTGSGVDVGKSADAKRKDMNKIEFSQGPAAYFFDAIDPFFLPEFVKSSNGTFFAFMKVIL